MLVSDGQAWSGEIAKSLQLARSLDIPVHVVGVGTSYGGLIPQAPLEAGQTTARVARSTSPILSILDRASLQQIATEGNGLYFDLERDGDRTVATTIVEATRRRAGTRALEESFEELHRYCLLAAAWLFGFSVLLLRERVELWLIVIGAGAALAAVWGLLR